jgi:DNA-binding protein HU-beta
MNKADLITALAVRTGASRADAGKSLDAVLDIVQQTLAKGEEINIAGFGKFEVVETAQKQGRNPRTGAAVTIPAGKQPKFRAGAGLKKAIGGEAVVT